MKNIPIDLRTRRDSKTNEHVQRRLLARRGPEHAYDPQDSAKTIAGQAAWIRNQIKSFGNRRLPGDDRIALAYNMYILLGPLRARRGALTEVLVQAGISRPEDHTKRLSRYQVADRSQADPKALSSRLRDYVRLATSAADLLGENPDHLLLRLVEGSQFDPRLDKKHVSLEEFLKVESLHEFFAQASDAIVKETRLDEYFKNLARWRWLKPLCRAPWIMDDLIPSPRYPDGDFFWRARLNLIPKVELASVSIFRTLGAELAFPMPRWPSKCISMKDIEWMPEESLFAAMPRDDETDSEIDTEKLCFEIRATIWWGLAPFGDGGRVVGCLIHSVDLLMSGEIIIDHSRTINIQNERLDGSVWVDAKLGGVIFDLSPPELDYNIYFDTGWDIGDVWQRSVPAAFESVGSGYSRIQPLTMSSVFSELIEKGASKPFDIICGVSQDNSISGVKGVGPTRTPEGTLAAVVESHFRYVPMHDPKRIDMKLLNVCQALKEEMKCETALVDQALEKGINDYRAFWQARLQRSSDDWPNS